VCFYIYVLQNIPFHEPLFIFIVELWVICGRTVDYIRKTQPRHAHSKNGDVQITRLHHRVSHYRVIRDMRPSASSIRIHLRRALCWNLRRDIRSCVVNLIVGWGHSGTNTRHAKSSASPITKKYETRFNLACHRFDCRMGPLWH
jgi:hypothetical protein